MLYHTDDDFDREVMELKLIYSHKNKIDKIEFAVVQYEAYWLIQHDPTVQTPGQTSLPKRNMTKIFLLLFSLSRHLTKI